MRRILQLAALCLIPLLAQQQGPQWKNQAEYDLYTAIQKENDPQKKLALIDNWKAKYPDSQLKQQRLALYLNLYQHLDNIPKLIETLNEMLVLDPKDLRLMNGIMVYTPQLKQPGPADLDNAVKAANSALANLEVRPAGTDDAQWPTFRKGVEALAHTTLGWAAMTRKDDAAAEQEFLRSLQTDPNQGQVDLWLAGVLRNQKTPAKISQALFYYARAAVYDGPGALPAPARRQLDDYLRKAYTGYHGDDTGLEDLKKLAVSQPMPPAGFTVPTAAEVAALKQQQLQQGNPQLALWLTLKQQLTAPSAGQQFFNASMKGADVPGGAQGVTAFRGTVISADRQELRVAVSDNKTPEVTLKLDKPIVGKVELGSEVEFDGVPEEFTADPFNVTFAVERAKLKGLKVQAAPVHHKKAVARKRAT